MSASELVNIESELRATLGPFAGRYPELIRRWMALPRLDSLLARAARRSSAADVCHFTLRALRIEVDVHPAAIEQIPREGPLLVVSNHPSGIADGMALIHLVARRRADFRLLTNRLACIPSLRHAVLPLDLFGGSDRLLPNRAAVRQAIDHLHAGGALGLFPAGVVARFDARRLRVVETSWGTMLGRLVRRTDCAVLPVTLARRTSVLFHAAGLLSSTLRSMLLPRELLRGGGAIGVRIGRAILPSQFGINSAVEAITEQVRREVLTPILDPPTLRPARSSPWTMSHPASFRRRPSFSDL